VKASLLAFLVLAIVFVIILIVIVDSGTNF
jgi:hypothetical protein